MIIDIGIWYLFPLSLIIASIAMMTGIGGAVMFTPVFMLVLGLDAVSAFATGLFVELFGFTSGVVGFLRKNLIDFSIVKKLAIVSIPSVFFGIIIARMLHTNILKLLLAILLLYLSISFLNEKKKCSPQKLSGTTSTISSKSVLRKPISSSIYFSSFLGATLLGAISSGLGEINEYNFLKKLKLPFAIASGTSVFLVAISALTGVFIHTILFLTTSNDFVFMDIITILVFVLPGVVIGAQLGVFMSQIINTDKIGRFVGGLFLVLFIMVIVTML